VPTPSTPASIARSVVSVYEGSSYTITWGDAENLIEGGLIRLDRRLLTCPGGTPSCWSGVTTATEGGSHSVTDDVAGTYVYTVYACNPNGGGCSDPINTSVEVKIVPRPDPVSFINRSDVSVILGGSYTISWGDAENLIEGGIIRLDRRLLTCPGGTPSCWSGVTTATESGSHSISDEVAGTYVYIVYACNPNGGGCSDSINTSVEVTGKIQSIQTELLGAPVVTN